MFSRKEKKKNNKIDIDNLNEVINLSSKILKMTYIFIIIIGIYFLIKVFKELEIKNTMIIILKTITPLFIGLFIAWLFDPCVKYLHHKGIKRGIGTTIVYISLLSVLAIIIGSLIPVLSEQLNEFVKALPSIFDTIKGWTDGIFNNLDTIESFDANSVKIELFRKIEEFGMEIANSLPEIAVSSAKAIISGAGSLVVGLIIGFYLLMSFDSANDLIITLLPKKIQNDARELINEVNTSLRKFIQGLLIDATLIFVITSLGFWLCGLRAPLLFGLFCGITNVIPYAGPYIGGIPAVIVGFSQGPLTGILTLIIIFVVQFFEGNFLQPFVMSKTTKLHPVTIILGLLIFGYFFGIIGMVISTPIIAACKSIFIFFNEKFKIINYD